MDLQRDRQPEYIFVNQSTHGDIQPEDIGRWTNKLKD